MLSTASAELKETILLGDMNIDYLKKADHAEIKTIIDIQGLEQLIKKPTRVTNNSKTLIDIICSTKPSSISKTDTIPTSISDHDMVGLVRKLNHFKYTPKTIRCRNYSKYNHEVMCNELNKFD